MLGRSFGEEPGVVVISQAYAQAHFGSPAAAMGQSLKLDRKQYTVIGVMPRGFWISVQWRYPVCRVIIGSNRSLAAMIL